MASTCAMSDEKTLPPSLFANPGEHSQGKRNNFLIFLTLSLITLAQAFESTSLCVTLPIIGEDLGANLSETLGFGSSFLLGMTLAQPLGSELSFMAGRRSAILLGVAVFIGGTVMSGLATNAAMLLAGRALSGLGAGISEPVKALVLYDLFTLRERAKWVAFINVSWVIGTVAGPLLAGKFTQDVDITWRWVFWMNLPLLCLSFIASAFLLGYDDHLRRHKWDLAKLVDWVGLVLFMGSGASICVGLTFGGSRFPWRSANAIVPVVLGLLGFVAFGFYESRVAPKPLFPSSVLRHSSTVIQCINVVIHGLLMFMILYFMSIFFLGVKNMSPLMTGVWSLPASLTVAPMALIVGIVVHRTGHYRYFLLGGWVVTVINLGLTQLLDRELPDVALVMLGLVGGASFGALVPGMAIGIQATVDRMDAGYAICLTLLLRPAGQCLGVAIGQAFFAKRLDTIFSRDGFPDGFAQEVMGYIRRGLDPETTGMDSGAAERIPVIIDGIVEALRTVWIVAAVLAGLALILTCWAECPRLPDDRRQCEQGIIDGDVKPNEQVANETSKGSVSMSVSVGGASELDVPLPVQSPECGAKYRASLRQSQDVARWSDVLQHELSMIEPKNT